MYSPEAGSDLYAVPLRLFWTSEALSYPPSPGPYDGWVRGIFDIPTTFFHYYTAA